MGRVGRIRCLVLVGVLLCVAPAPAESARVTVPADLAGAECPATGGDDVPRHISTSGDGDEVPLSILVLLDHVPRGEAARLITRVGEMYASMHVRLVPRFVSAPQEPDGVAGDGQPTLSALRVMGELSASYRGADAHLILLLTPKDLVLDDASQDPNGGLAGMAACGGGALYTGSNIAVSETKYRHATRGLPDDTHVVTAAHEIGHLLGALHEHGNCAEGRTSPPLVSAGSCTAMAGFAPANVSERFGSLERRVIRGYAEAATSRS